MRAVVQRVSRAHVEIDGQTVGAIDSGLVVLLGVHHDDSRQDADHLVEKVIGLRIFNDQAGKMNLALDEAGGGLLIISQFTLYGDARRGRRPSFIDAAGPELGNELYEYFLQRARGQGRVVANGRFGADMQVTLTNDGPVTILLDSRKLF
jgi:D-tyrosyl-tRNA(Tyr) deacylase